MVEEPRNEPGSVSGISEGLGPFLITWLLFGPASLTSFDPVVPIKGEMAW